MGDRQMIRLSSIIQQFESTFLAQYQGRILPSHRQALAAMKVCRTHRSPRMLEGCTECDYRLTVPHSCGHRNCPHCQNFESQQWLERQLQKRVPAKYFLLTFTLPAELRTLAWHHQRLLYTGMIQCVWETVRTFAQNDQQLRGIPGAIAVLHTHSRRLDYHPHVHLVMPGAAMDADQRLWLTKGGNRKNQKPYLFSHKALAKVFRAKLLEAITREGLVLPPSYPTEWVVNCKAVGTGEKALIYLARYLYRGVIREKDLVACTKGKVRFRYRNGKTKHMEYRTVTGERFLWLILQHVLPKGFRRARNFGFLHPNSKRLIRLLQYLVGLDPSHALASIQSRPRMICPCCGAMMKVLATRLPPGFVLPTPMPT